MEGLRSYIVGLEDLRYLRSVCIMHPGVHALRRAVRRRGAVCLSLAVGTAWYCSACVLLRGKGCENLPEGHPGGNLDFGVTAKQALAPPPSIRNRPWGQRCPEVMYTPEHFGLCSFCLCPLKTPTPATRESARASKRRLNPCVPHTLPLGAGWGYPGKPQPATWLPSPYTPMLGGMWWAQEEGTAPIPCHGEG